MVYVALLRGVNVGGARKVSMGHLAELFQSLGFTSVKTFINSGNIIFASSEANKKLLAERIEQLIEKETGVTTGVLVKSLTDIEMIVSQLPNSWVNDAYMKCDVMFLFSGIDSKTILKTLPAINPDYEDCTYAPGAILWRVDRTFVNRSKMLKLASLPLYQQMTVRNCNSVRKILALMRTTQDV